MLIKCDGFWSYITNEEPETIDDAKHALTLDYYDFQNKVTTTSKFYLIHSKICGIETIKFPTGLCDWVQSKLHLEEELKSDFSAVKPSKLQVSELFDEIHSLNPNFEVRDYQITAAHTSLSQYQSLIYASVGSGKTSIMVSVVKYLKSTDKILIINDNGLILNQIYDRLLSIGIDASEISNDINDLSRPISVISSDMLYRRLKSDNNQYIIDYLSQLNTLIIDEAQHFQAISSFLPMLYTTPGVLRHVIGYSGSPFRDHKRPFTNPTDLLTIGLLGSPAFTYDIKDAMTGGNIAKAHSYFINYNGIKPNIKTDNYFVLYNRNIPKNKARNKSGIAMLEFLNQYKLKTLALFSFVEAHALPVLQELTKKKVKAMIVKGGAGVKKGIKQCVYYEYLPTSEGKLELSTHKGPIDEMVEALKGDYNIILASSIMNEGVDISLFDAGILFSGGKSPISITQQLGRVSRKKSDGLNVSLIIDFKDINCDGMFINQYNKRKQLLAQQGVTNLEKVQDFIAFVKEVSYNKEQAKKENC